MTIFYVDNPKKSKAFYHKLFNSEPVLESDTFVLFELSKGNKFGLWSKHTVTPDANEVSECVEFAIELSSRDEVDAIFNELRDDEVTICQSARTLDFGYALTALDPDGHRLRFYHLEMNT
jgi:predicted lactoylglutathione lyase